MDLPASTDEPAEVEVNMKPELELGPTETPVEDHMDSQKKKYLEDTSVSPDTQSSTTEISSLPPPRP